MNAQVGIQKDGGVEGAQSILRAARLIDQVARKDGGARLTDLASSQQLHLATARRILQSLVQAGLLSFDATSKTYSIGPAVFSYALMGSPWFSRRETFARILDRIAQQTQDTVTVLIRSGDEAVCLDRREGSFPVKVLNLAPGDRRPLGAGSGGTAILAFLPDEERNAILQRNVPAYERLGLSPSKVSRCVDEARETGFGFNPGLVIKDVLGVAVPLISGGNVVAAISVVAISRRITPQRVPQIVNIIREAASRIPSVSVPCQSRRRPRSNAQSL